MRYRPRVLPTASVEEGVGVIETLGPGIAVLDLEHAFAGQALTPDAWAMYFRDIHDRLDANGVRMIVIASPRNREATVQTIPAALATVVDRATRPGVTASRVAEVAHEEHGPIVALWGEQSVTNARLARRLHAPLVRVDAPIDSARRRTSRRLADTLLSHRRV
jgi:hypothetical protein